MLITLLKIEWLKIKKYKAFWIILGFLIFLLPLITVGAAEFYTETTKQMQGVDTLIGGPFNFNKIFATTAYLNNGLNIAWGMLLILMIGNEFQSRTIRQNVIDGQKREAIIHSKLLLVLIFSFISAALVLVSGFITGFFYSTTSFYFSTDLFKIFGISFFAAIIQMLFSLLFAFMIKKPAISVILYLIYTVFIENIVVGIMAGLMRFKYGKLLFTQAADELTENPFTKNLATTPASEILNHNLVWVACIFYAVAILFFLYRYINRTVLK